MNLVRNSELFVRFSIWQGKGTCKSHVNFLKSLAPYIGKEFRDVGGVSAHKTEYLRRLIMNVEMFLDLVNVVEKTFEIPLMKNKLSVHSKCPWKSLFVSARDQKKTKCTI